MTPLVRTERGQRVAQHLLSFVATEAAKAAPHERLLGSSEVIELVLGKLQTTRTASGPERLYRLGARGRGPGGTHSPAVIQQALETVPTS